MCLAVRLVIGECKLPAARYDVRVQMRCDCVYAISCVINANKGKSHKSTGPFARLTAR